MVLQYKPDKWRIEDCLAVSRWLAWEMTSQWKTEILLSNILNDLGPEKSQFLFPRNTNIFRHHELEPSPRMLLSKEFIGKTHFSPLGTGSNGWVLSGKRTSNGKSFLATDPHVALTSPSIFYEVHLEGGDFHVQGLSLPGLPGVIIGQNENIAWGLTNLMADDQDLFIERVHSSNPNLVYFDGSWESITVIKEEIPVKRDSSITIQIFETRNGPVISDFLKENNSGSIVSLKWTGLEIGDEGLAYYQLNKAKDWPAFRKSLKAYCVTPQHFLYADKNGNIGVQAAGPVPVREKGITLLPRPGHDPDYQWKGTIPWNEMPSLYNPEQGWIAAANYPIGDISMDNLSILWPVSWRNDRINKSIQQKETLAIQDCQNIQSDRYSAFAKDLSSWVIRNIEERLDAPREKRCLQLLREWDGQLRTGSSAAALSQTLIQKLMDNIFQDELGKDLYNQILLYQNIMSQALDRLMQGENPLWFDNIKTRDIRESKNEIILISFQEAIQFLQQKIHEEPDKWSWGKLHKLTFKHPFGKMPLFGRIFNIGPFPVGGSGTAINCFGYLFSKPFETAWGPGARIVFDLRDPDNSVAVIPTGQSGQPQDEHYNDQLPLYLGNMFHPMLMDTSKIRQSGWDHLHLMPGGQHE